MTRLSCIPQGGSLRRLEREIGQGFKFIRHPAPTPSSVLDAAAVHAVNPACDVKALPVVGYFLDHDNFQRTDGYPGGPNSAAARPITAHGLSLLHEYQMAPLLTHTPRRKSDLRADEPPASGRCSMSATRG